MFKEHKVFRRKFSLCYSVRDSTVLYVIRTIRRFHIYEDKKNDAFCVK